MCAEQVVVIAAGGTGGHIYPGLAVVEKLKEVNVPVVWIGTKEGMESRIVPDAGIDIHWIRVNGLRGKGVAGIFAAPFKLVLACSQSMKILKQVGASTVLGMGGFVSGPVGIAAILMRKPLVLHEQNAIAGMTNRYLSRFAKRVFAAMPNVFPEKIQAEVVGNPMRNTLARKSTTDFDAAELHDRPLRLLVVGGSRGAQALNELVPQVLHKLAAGSIEIFHQTGENDYEGVSAAYKNSGKLAVGSKAQAFINDMPAAYAWADVAICRAGAMTVSELSAVGLPSILVPYPFAVDDHQTMNAGFLSSVGGAVLIQQADLNLVGLATQLQLFIDQPQLLKKMAAAAAKQHRPDAAQRVADVLVEVAC